MMKMTVSGDNSNMFSERCNGLLCTMRESFSLVFVLRAIMHQEEGHR